MRTLKFFIGLALLPLCWAATTSLVALIQSLRVDAMGDVPLSTWWLAGGFVIWLVLFAALPRPMRAYVLGHELTHAFWALLMGARVSRLRVNSRGGSVNVSKSNFIITLAPYFFPFYTVLVLALYLGVSLLVDLTTFEPLWLALVGLTWSFHLTFTIAILTQHQPDIAEHGRVFSYAVIYLLNMLGVGLWIVGVASPTLVFFANCLLEESRTLYAVTADWARTGWAFAQPVFPMIGNWVSEKFQ